MNQDSVPALPVACLKSQTDFSAVFSYNLRMFMTRLQFFPAFNRTKNHPNKCVVLCYTTDFVALISFMSIELHPEAFLSMPSDNAPFKAEI